MIPLARWLETGSPPGLAVSMPYDAGVEDGASVPLFTAENDSVPADVSDPRDDHIAELEEALRLSQQEAERLKDEMKQREVDMLERLGAMSAEAIAESMNTAMSRMRLDLETVLADVLTPFISGQIRQRATSDLLDLVATAVSESHSVELDIHAPSELHDILGEHLTRGNISARFHESNQIMVSCGSLRSRFEELSAQWLSQIDGRTE